MTAHARTLAYVVNSLNPGGTERLVVEMSRAFSQEYNVQVFCLDEPGTWAESLRDRGIAVHALWRQPGIDLSIPTKLAGHFRKHQVDLVHAHQCTPWFYSALSRTMYGKPRLLFEEHGRFYPEEESPARRAVNRLLIRRLTHRVVAVSSDIRGRLVRFEGLDAAEIEVIYNGVEPAPILKADERNALRSTLGFSPNEFVVGTIGRFDSIKNLPMLVGGLEMAGRQAETLGGLLIGDGPEFEQISALVGRGPMQNRIKLTGYRSDARELVQCLDLFALSSFSEGTSMALLEAMAAGVAVVVTEVGGNPEIVLTGETGWTVQSGAIEALAAAILEAIREPERRRRLARAGQERFEQHFAMDRMLASYAERYRQMLAN